MFTFLCFSHLGNATFSRLPLNCVCIILLLLNTVKSCYQNSLSCYQCIGTHPGCTLYDMDWIFQDTITCSRKDDRCVKLLERKGPDVMVTRDCLSNLEAHRVDIPADKYEGCYSATRDTKLAQYTFNRIKELDVSRSYYDNVTWCICQFDHYCNSANETRYLPSIHKLIQTFLVISIYFA